MIKLLRAFIIISFLFIISCKTTRNYIDAGMKFYYYETESYNILFSLSKEELIKLVPKNFKLAEKPLLLLFINRYKKIHIPKAEPYYEAGLYILINFKKKHSFWYPLISITSIQPSNIPPMQNLGYKSFYGIIDYSPSGTTLRTIVKKDYSLFLEFEFSFLPTEDAKLTPEKELVVNSPVILGSGENPVFITNLNKENNVKINIKDGVGAFVFHKSAEHDFRFLNKAKIESVFFVEKVGDLTYRAYYEK